MGNKPVNKVLFSDGCSAQYKSRGPFSDISLESDVRVDRNYFGSEHGKGDCDAETGIVNRATDRAIIGNHVVINNGEDMYNYCQRNLQLNETLSKRSFILVRAGDICRMRPETEVKPLQNTRNIHQLINIEGRKYVVMTRNLSCFCKFCKLQNYQNCLNMEYVEPYETHELIHTAEVATSKQEQQNNNQEQQLQTERTSASREQYFNKKLKSLLNSENFSQMLEILVKEDTLSEYEELPNPAPQTFVNTALLIDGLSKDLVPDDIPLQPSLNMYPAQIYGDGNCLPRCASVIAFGDQDHHEEMRFRVVRELVIHKAFYMEDTNLAGKHLRESFG